MSGLRVERDDVESTSRGVTLVELLLVIVILGVLAGIVVFAVGNTTSNAQKQACRTEAQVVESAVVAAAANRPPVALTGDHPKTDASALAAAGILKSSNLKYIDDGQTFEPGTDPTGWTYAGSSVDYTGCN